MGNDLIDQLVARTKALGLVTATALVTTALVGGGAVAMTTVSNETPRDDAPVSVAGVGDEQRSDTATAKIKDKKPRTGPAPVCGTARNHGAHVSGVAQSASPGPSHGPKVAAAATSDCGKPAGAKAGKAATKGKPAKKPAKTRPGRPDSPGKSADKGANGG